MTNLLSFEQFKEIVRRELNSELEDNAFEDASNDPSWDSTYSGRCFYCGDYKYAKGVWHFGEGEGETLIEARADNAEAKRWSHYDRGIEA